MIVGPPRQTRVITAGAAGRGWCVCFRGAVRAEVCASLVVVGATLRLASLAQGAPELISGRLDSNQRPPAPKSASSRTPATLCETYMGHQLLDPKRFDARNRRTSLGQKSRVEPRWNPKRYRLSRRIWRHAPLSWPPIGAGAASAAGDSPCRSSLAALIGRHRPASDARPRAYGP
jgi:hypothetical protein